MYVFYRVICTVHARTIHDNFGHFGYIAESIAGGTVVTSLVALRDAVESQVVAADIDRTVEWNR